MTLKPEMSWGTLFARLSAQRVMVAFVMYTIAVVAPEERATFFKQIDTQRQEFFALREQDEIRHGTQLHTIEQTCESGIKDNRQMVEDLRRFVLERCLPGGRREP